MASKNKRQPAQHTRPNGERNDSGGPVSRLNPYLILIVASLIALNIAIYTQVTEHSFVTWDDPPYVTENAHVNRGLTWENAAWAFTTPHAANWHPLTWLSHMLDVSLFGVRAGPHLLTNVFLHTLNTLLLFGLLRSMTGRTALCAFVAALFAVHPLHVQSVAWVSERKDVLSTLFFMLTLWAYIAYVRRPGRARYGAIILFFAMGLLAKPMLVTLPFLLLLLDVWPLERLFTVSDADVSPSWISKIRNNVPILRERLLEKLPLFLLAAFSSAITFRVQRGAGAVMSTPLGMRLANVPLSYVAYIRKMFWPTQLSPLYPYPSSIANWTVAATVIALVVVSLILFKAGRRWRYCTAGWLWFLVGLTPVIGLVQVGTQAMADRYTYVPLIGLFIILAWGASDALSYFGRRTAAAVLIPTAFAIVLICAAVSRNEVSYWKDSATLWSHALAVTEDNYIAHTHLANELRNQGKLREAQEHYREAIRINASYPEPHNGLGVLLAEEGRILAAIKEYETVLKLDPMHALAHNNIANVLVNQRKGDEAIAHYRMAVRIKPDYADARNNLGVALINRGKLDEAILELREALRLKPDADVHYNLGEAYERTQHPVEAKSEYESALSLAPNHKPAADALRRLNR